MTIDPEKAKGLSEYGVLDMLERFDNLVNSVIVVETTNGMMCPVCGKQTSLRAYPMKKRDRCEPMQHEPDCLWKDADERLDFLRKEEE